MPDDEDVVQRDIGIRVLVRVAEQPVLITLVPDQELEAFDAVGEAGQLRRELLRDHYDLRIRVADHVLMRLGGIAPVERNAHQVRRDGAHVEVSRLDAVVLQHGHPVACGQAHPQQGIREPHAAVPRLTEGEFPA